MTALIPYVNSTAVASLQILDEAQEEFRISSRAPATRTAYAADWEHFSGWCRAHDIEPLPAAAVIVSKYLSSLALAKKSTSTIGRRLAAIRFVHKQSGMPAPKSDALTETLSGIRRTIGVAPTRRKSAVTVDILQTALDGIRGHTAKDVRDRAILALGFSAALRRSEIVALNVEDLEFCTEGVRVHIRRSKTDQTGEGAEIAVPLGKQVFPVRILRDWLEVSGINSGPVFVRIHRGGRITTDRLASRNVATLVKQRLRAVGLEVANYSGHSLRSGFVTTAVSAGANLFRIADTTRHKQLATLKMYDRKVRAFEGCAGDAFL
jgi:site-specific recombinase XerD